MYSNERLHERYASTHPFSDSTEVLKSSRNKRIQFLRTLRQSIVGKKREEFIRLMELHTSDKNDQQPHSNLNVTIIPLPTNYFFKLLVIPEFLLGTKNTVVEESQMISDSVFFPRPSGKRLIVQIKNFVVRAFDKGGILRYNFNTDLCKGPTLLDVVVQKNKFYVCDVLFYNGILMASSPADCRLFFIKSRIQESADSIFQCVDYHHTSVADLQRVYELTENSQNVEYDSLVFLARNAEYMGGYNPFWLVWRDNSISKYDEAGTPCRVFLDTKAGNLSTLDGVHIGTMNLAGFKHKRRKIIVKINVSKVDLDNLQILNYSIVTGRNNSMLLSTSGPLPHSLRQILSRFRYDGKSMFYDLLHELENISIIHIDD